MASRTDNIASNLNLANFSKATELKNRIWFTVGALIVFRFLSFVPLPGVNPLILESLYEQTRGGILDIFNTFSGGSLERMSLIALGVMPYITASIVVQLAASLHPALGALKKEGETGRKKLNQYTRYGAVLLTAVQGWFIASGLEAYAASPLQLVVIPFQGKPGEGTEIVAYLRLPKTGTAPYPVVMIWGGIDSFKEERRVERYLKAGMATLSIDMPGVGEAPLAGSEDAERMWDPIFDWIAAKPALDATRVAVVGCSTGGYWATKLAHTHKHRLAAAINHGGPAHFAFTEEWIHEAAHGEYPFDLAETLACAFGRASFEEWVAYAPKLSLLDMGLLDKPCAPLLCVNGVDDSVFPIRDHYLLLQHGNAKSARFFPGGHMGHGDGWDVTDTLVGWLAGHLLPAAARDKVQA